MNFKQTRVNDDHPFPLQCGPRSPTRVQFFVRMLGYVLFRQPIVILREYVL